MPLVCSEAYLHVCCVFTLLAKRQLLCAIFSAVVTLPLVHLQNDAPESSLVLQHWHGAIQAFGYATQLGALQDARMARNPTPTFGSASASAAKG